VQRRGKRKRKEKKKSLKKKDAEKGSKKKDVEGSKKKDVEGSKKKDVEGSKKKDVEKDSKKKDVEKDSKINDDKKEETRKELMILSYPSNSVVGSVFVNPKMCLFEVRARINEELEGMEGFPDTEHYIFVSAKGVPISPKQEEDRLIGMYLPQLIVKDLEV